MKKKAYITPSLEVIEINAQNLLATSMGIMNGTDDPEVDTTQDGGQLGRENHPSNPNLWDNAW